MNTGKQIRQLRKSRNLSQRDLAKLLNCSPAAVAQLEARENCGVEILSKVAEALEYKMEINFKPLNKIKMSTQKINYFWREMFNDDGAKYGIEYIYFPAILAAGMPEGVQAGFDPSNGNDHEPSNDIWQQTFVSRCNTIEEALTRYEE